MLPATEGSLFCVLEAVFDGTDFRGSPLRERKRRLRRLLGHRRGRVRHLDHVVGHGVDLFRLICTEDLEGIVAKHAHGTYDPTATTWWKRARCIREMRGALERGTSMDDIVRRLKAYPSGMSQLEETWAARVERP